MSWNEINLEVAEGEFVCIVGPSGCGKTTLLNIIAGFSQASRGEMLVEGEPVEGPTGGGSSFFRRGASSPGSPSATNIGFGLDRLRPVGHETL